MRTKIVSLMIVGLLFAGVFLAIAPTASAQAANPVVVVKITPSDTKVKPLQGTVAYSGTTEITVEPTAGSQLTGIPIQYTVKSNPAWASVVISPQSDIAPVPQAGAGQSATVTITRTFSIIVSATDQAPAFAPSTVEILATIPGSPQIKGASATGPVQITADYFSIIDVQLAESIKVERPQQPVVFPLTISNFGNANTKVSFEVIQAAESLKDGIIIPNPVTLQSKQAGGNQITATVPLTVQTPYKNGYLNEVGVVTYKVTSAYALDSSLKGDESIVSVLVTTKGFYVPGFSPVFLVGLLGLAAVLMRRRG